jgi:amidase
MKPSIPELGDSDAIIERMQRRAFLGGAVASAAAALAQSAAQQFDIAEMTVAELGSGLRSGRFTAQALVERYLERIELIDRRGPGLNAVIEINPEAESIAAERDRELRAKSVRGPLHGIPVLIKDNIDTADKMKTTAGSLALLQSKPARDAFLVERLRAAGAVILGKTNLSEWANFRSNHSVSGWSARGGQTRNPYALDRNPSGSSSGSAVAVAANLCAAAVGTETDGSITSPASINGIVGIKPTLGLVSRAGIVPIAHSQDTAGPMARCVADAATLLTALCGADARDPATHTSAGRAADYTRFLDRSALRGVRIGVARKYFGANREVDALMEKRISDMKALGAEIVDPADIPTHNQWKDSEFQALLYEFKADLNAYLSGLGSAASVRSLSDVIEFNRNNEAREMPYFGQDIMEEAEKKGPLTEKGYIEALARNHNLAREQGIDAVIAKYKLDAMAAPTSGPAWLIDWINGDQGVADCTSAAAVAGYPHITVPMGFVRGLPVGLSFFGPAWSEPKLIAIAYAFEQAVNARRQPRFLPSAPLA